MTDDIQRTLGRIESKLDSVLDDQKQDRERMNHHSDRIAKLERWQARVLGAVTVSAFVLGFVLKNLFGD